MAHLLALGMALQPSFMPMERQQAPGVMNPVGHGFASAPAGLWMPGMKQRGSPTKSRGDVLPATVQTYGQLIDSNPDAFLQLLKVCVPMLSPCQSQHDLLCCLKVGWNRLPHDLLQVKKVTEFVTAMNMEYQFANKPLQGLSLDDIRKKDKAAVAEYMQQMQMKQLQQQQNLQQMQGMQQTQQMPQAQQSMHVHGWPWLAPAGDAASKLAEQAALSLSLSSNHTQAVLRKDPAQHLYVECMGRKRYLASKEEGGADDWCLTPRGTQCHSDSLQVTVHVLDILHGNAITAFKPSAQDEGSEYGEESEESEEQVRDKAIDAAEPEPDDSQKTLTFGEACVPDNVPKVGPVPLGALPAADTGNLEGGNPVPVETGIAAAIVAASSAEVMALTGTVAMGEAKDHVLAAEAQTTKQTTKRTTALPNYQPYDKTSNQTSKHPTKQLHNQTNNHSTNQLLAVTKASVPVASMAAEQVAFAAEEGIQAALVAAAHADSVTAGITDAASPPGPCLIDPELNMDKVVLAAASAALPAAKTGNLEEVNTVPVEVALVPDDSNKALSHDKAAPAMAESSLAAAEAAPVHVPALTAAAKPGNILEALGAAKPTDHAPEAAKKEPRKRKDKSSEDKSSRKPKDSKEPKKAKQ